MAYLNGEIDLYEAAEKMGVSSDAFRKRLKRLIITYHTRQVGHPITVASRFLRDLEG
jgi:hypothetical protein